MANSRFIVVALVVRENLRDIFLSALVLSLCFLAVTALVARQASPIISRDRMTGTVATVLDASPSPDTALTGGSRYLYGVRLRENNTLVFVYNDAPRTAGSDVSIERQHRENDSDTFRLLRD
ncbi:hypothetical protein LGH82_24940 [Mesorhizobium sp. PAMC28654]|uniref:hypothetical protein n=1 Tax=Mesorhizobium sp. PAMC28654 TaxID=2880934 RepID=UPI001D0B96A0|nr:hypothetical protein [Mesorhizobium sp. PAMC28654]UDL88355.1 hypothetical protein LGH82_24940 [Mesorhizobium sp. PAMC28654]